MDPNSYDVILAAFSGGKDSIACVLHLLEMGVPPEKIELWHHEVDGREGSTLMDWTCTPAYCRAFAAAFGLRIYFSWKVGGFEREMLRDGAPTAPTVFETPEGLVQVGGSGPAGTRRCFPQVAADLSVRWCSAYLKIDVMATAIRNQDRFCGKKTLVVTGERAEESKARSRYETFEPNRSDRRAGRKARHIDHWRPVHGWAEAQVWDIMRRHRVNPHPAYRLGFGRVSCLNCIFASADQAASARAVSPEGFDKVARYEAQFGKTIKRSMSLLVLADRGTPYDMGAADLAAARSSEFSEPVILPEGAWRMPSGAFGESCGPV